MRTAVGLMPRCSSILIALSLIIGPIIPKALPSLPTAVLLLVAVDVASLSLVITLVVALVVTLFVVALVAFIVVENH